MSKVFAIIGAVLFAVGVGIGFFGNFPLADAVAIAVDSFGLAALIVATVKKAKDEGRFNWMTIVVIVLSVVSGVLLCLGDLQSNIIETIGGAVIALLTIIFGIWKATKK